MSARMSNVVAVSHRLAHGGQLDLRLHTDGRVQLFLDSDAHVAELLCELDSLADVLGQFQVRLVRAQHQPDQSTRKRAA